MKKFTLIALIFGISMIAGQLNAAGWGRISEIEGDVLIIGEDDTRWGYATINTIVEEGDIIRTEDNSRVEIQLEDGAVVRLDELSELEFTVLEEDGKTVVTAIEGVIGVSLPYWLPRRNFHIAFPSGELMPYRGAKVRIEVEGDDGTYVIVRRERAILTTFYDERTIKSHRMAFVDVDGNIQWVRRYYERDRFDRWCDRRDRVVLRRPSIPPDVDFDIVVGVIDLDFYGHWTHVPPYGWVWVPDAPPGWRPYWHGHWVWTSRWGWVWVDYEPWGWVTCHYGRWAFVVGVGWVWVPRAVFGPAWVVWSYGPGWVAWAPLDPFGHPITVINNITIINFVDYNSFVNPVYRYRPPVNGRYDKPYRTMSRPPTSPSSVTWQKRPPRSEIKPAPPKADIKQRLIAEKAKSIRVVERSPIRKLVAEKIERKRQVLEREGVALQRLKPKTAVQPDMKRTMRHTTVGKSEQPIVPKAETQIGRERRGSRIPILIDEEQRSIRTESEKSRIRLERPKTTHETDEYRIERESRTSRRKSKVLDTIIRESDKSEVSKDRTSKSEKRTSRASISVRLQRSSRKTNDVRTERHTKVKADRTTRKTSVKTTVKVSRKRTKSNDEDKKAKRRVW